MQGYLEVSQKQFGDTTFTIRKLNVMQSRILMARLAKVLGGPFLKLFSLDISEDDDSLSDLDFEVFASMLAGISPEESVGIIKDLCELTINQAKGRPTNYVNDFLPHQTTDIEVALWVAKEQFGDFFTGLLKSNLAEEAIALMPATEST